MADSKAGKPRRIPLTDEGVALFANLTAGKFESEAIFTRSDASPWYRMALVLEGFPGLELVSFSFVGDDGNLYEDYLPVQMPASELACGLFEFTKAEP